MDPGIEKVINAKAFREGLMKQRTLMADVIPTIVHLTVFLKHSAFNVKIGRLNSHPFTESFWNPLHNGQKSNQTDVDQPQDAQFIY